MAEFDVDLFVIGGGSGGVRAARIAAGYGARVMVAEEYRMGGTCVIRGCVPKKLFVIGSHFKHEIEDAAGFGWTVPSASFDWPTLVANKDKEIARLEGIYAANVEKTGARIVAKTRAVLEDAHTLRLMTGEKVTAKYILIATGGAPNHGREIPGIEHVISSNEAFHLAELPKRIVIQGGGYIALEFAGIFAGFGSDVTVIYRGDNILRGFDEDVRKHARAEMEKLGITIITGCTIEKVEKHGHEFTTHLSSGSSIASDQGDVRDRPAPQHRQSRAGEGRRRHQPGERRHRRGRVVKDLGRQHLRDRRRHAPHQSDAGGDPRGPCFRRHRVRQAPGPGRPRHDPDRRVLAA